MEILFGRFYFTLTSTGNLLGEFSNNRSQRCFTEAANRIIGNAPDVNERAISPFIADYETVWREPTGECICAQLEIRAKNMCAGIFTLIWIGNDKTELFHGEGMIVNGNLIGDYR